MKQPKETRNFKFVNLNPKNQRQGDCVVRAICNAMGMSWNTAFMKLTVIAFRKKTMPDCKLAYEAMIAKEGWIKRPQPRKPLGGKYSIYEFCDYHPKGTYIISCANHLTCVRDGRIEDIWDCGDKCVGNFWELLE